MKRYEERSLSTYVPLVFFLFADSNAHAAHTTPTIDSNAHNLYNTYIDSISSSNYIMDFVVVVFRHRRKQKNKFHFIGWSLCVYGQKYTKKKQKMFSQLLSSIQHARVYCLLCALQLYLASNRKLFFFVARSSLVRSRIQNICAYGSYCSYKWSDVSTVFEMEWMYHNEIAESYLSAK